ncbi:MAG: ComF family protein [Polyangiaceae bacterium]
MNDHPTSYRIVAGGSYTGALAIAVKRLKYSARPDLARPLGAWLSERARTANLTADLVIPVPLHPRKLRARGYNQSALLSAHVARSLGARFRPRALVRTRDTAPQASLDREARGDNIAGAFHARQIEAIRGKRVVLVDDVATTGATLRACVQALLDAGVASVTALVLARKDHPGAAAGEDAPATTFPG